MKNYLFLLVGIFFTSTVFAIPVTHIEQGSTWDYTFIGEVGPASGITSATYETYLTETSGKTWSSGEAAFSNAGAPTGGSVGTYWAANTDIAIKKTFSHSGLVSDLILNVAVDNGFAAFLNGTKIATTTAGGYTSYWEYSFAIDTSLLLEGDNELVVLGEDYGGLTYLDLKLSSSDVTPLPKPSPVPGPSIFSLLLIGFTSFVLRNIKKS